MNKGLKMIDVSKDFSEFPAGRFIGDGPYSGEKFRKELLVPALKEYPSVRVKIDGVRGYGSSFLEEAFGGLVREEGFAPEELKNKLAIEYQDEAFSMFYNEIWKFIAGKK